jgi:V8-like Glu-specific endopeptidase
MKNPFMFEAEPLEGIFEFEDTTEQEVIGPDTRQCVRNTTIAPFRYICSLDVDSEPYCSGTLIGPATVLTAGHCLDGVTPADMRVIPGRQGVSEPFGYARASVFHIPKDYVEATETDYGIINLESPIGKHVGFWTIDHSRRPGDDRGTSILQRRSLPLPPPLKVHIAGYPCDLPRMKSDPCFDSARDLKGKRQYRAYDETVRRTRTTPAGPRDILEYKNDTYHCMSGSPVWVKRSRDMGGRVLVAIHISGDDTTTPGRQNRGIVINSDILSFIRAHLR